MSVGVESSSTVVASESNAFSTSLSALLSSIVSFCPSQTAVVFDSKLFVVLSSTLMASPGVVVAASILFESTPSLLTSDKVIALNGLSKDRDWFDIFELVSVFCEKTSTIAVVLSQLLEFVLTESPLVLVLGPVLVLDEDEM